MPSVRRSGARSSQTGGRLRCGRLRAALAFIEVLTLRPDELAKADADAAYAAGVSREALRDAATVCAFFNMITRLADALDWDVPSSDRLTARAAAMLEGGYSFAAMRQR
jgi:alkylhydroperoxidase family enzyme